MAYGFQMAPLAITAPRDSTRIASGTNTAQQIQNSNAVNLVGGCFVGALVNITGTSVSISVYDSSDGTNTNPLFTGTVTAGTPVVLNLRLRNGLRIVPAAALTSDLIVTHSG